MDVESDHIGELLRQLKLSCNQLERHMESVYSQPPEETMEDSPPPLTTEAEELPSSNPFLELEKRMTRLTQKLEVEVTKEAKTYLASPTKRDSTGSVSRAGKKVDKGETSGSYNTSDKPAEDYEEESSPKKRSKTDASCP